MSECEGLINNDNYSASIEFENLRYTANLGFRKGYKEILHGINGVFFPGKLICILGPSGSGKTSLLNILSGFNRNGIKGNIKINGHERNMNSFKSMSCYITQENRLQPLLTVEENMKIATDLRLGFNTNRKSKNKTIDLILSTLGLTKVLDNRISNLSGGEKKRLSIALELINNPTIMFLDEPTTGLDNLSCFQCLEYLKHLAQQGKTIICTIHQPSATVFELFDDAYVLASGKCVYQGNSSKLLEFLEEVDFPCPPYHNPADYIIELSSGDFNIHAIDILVDKSNNGKCLDYFEASNYVKHIGGTGASDISEPFRTSNFYELKALLQREYIKAKRNSTLTHLRLITSILNSLVLCSIFYKVGSDGAKTWFNYSFVIGFMLHLMMPSLMLTIVTFPTEMSILKKEYFNRWYSLKTFYAAITIVDLPISITYCLISNVIVYNLTEQPMELHRFVMFAGISFLVIIVAQSMGLLVGLLFNIANGTFIGSAISAPMLVFGGFGIILKDIPSSLYYFSYFSYIRYGMEGMLGAVYGYCRKKLPCPNDDYCMYEDSEKFLFDMGIQGDRFWVDVLVLIFMFLFLRLVTYFALKWKLKEMK